MKSATSNSALKYGGSSAVAVVVTAAAMMLHADSQQQQEDREKWSSSSGERFGICRPPLASSSSDFGGSYPRPETPTTKQRTKSTTRNNHGISSSSPPMQHGSSGEETEEANKKNVTILRILQKFLLRQSLLAFSPPTTTQTESFKKHSSSVEYSSLQVPSDDDDILTEHHQQQNQKQVLPKGPRWAVAHPSTDFSGTWKPIVTDEFKQQYDTYLENCGTSLLFRTAVINFATTTREVITQSEWGRRLQLYAKTPLGSWKRTLISSGAEVDHVTSNEYERYHTQFLDPDKELVHVEAWWEQDGKVHKSWLRGKPRVDGGSFESTRYIEQCPTTGQDILVCESRFHPSQEHLQDPTSRFQPAWVRWKYQRVQ